ncbi:MAG TPA: FAD-dependent oxidoreductase, partial [Actinoplanes sp.]
MRTVTGPTDRVVVVGAGLGGLACALHLAAAGREVTVVEREPGPGGRAGRLSVDGYEFDTGPTVLTMPELIAAPLAAVGENLDDWLELEPLDPAYRAFYPDGSTLDVRTDTVRMAAEISRVCGPREADGYLRFVDFARRLWQLERHDFIDRNLDRPVDLVNLNLLRLIGMGGFRHLQPKINQFF